MKDGKKGAWKEGRNSADLLDFLYGIMIPLLRILALASVAVRVRIRMHI